MTGLLGAALATFAVLVGGAAVSLGAWASDYTPDGISVDV